MTSEIIPDYVGHRARMQEKLLTKGGDSFTEYEFLELVLMRAIPRQDVKPLAKRLLAHFGTFADVITASDEELRQFKNVKDSVISLFRLIEGACVRLKKSSLVRGPILADWAALLDYVYIRLAKENIERFSILFLDGKMRLIREELHQSGTIDNVPVYAREILKRALNLNAQKVILVHNHPSGATEPSKADIYQTDHLKHVLKAAEIELVEHLIIGKGSEVYSFKTHGWL